MKFLSQQNLGFRPYVLADLNTEFTYCFKLLNGNDENYKDDKSGKIFNLFIEFLKCLSNYNNKNKTYFTYRQIIYKRKTFRIR